MIKQLLILTLFISCDSLLDTDFEAVSIFNDKDKNLNGNWISIYGTDEINFNNGILTGTSSANVMYHTKDDKFLSIDYYFEPSNDDLRYQASSSGGYVTDYLIENDTLYITDFEGVAWYEKTDNGDYKYEYMKQSDDLGTLRTLTIKLINDSTIERTTIYAEKSVDDIILENHSEIEIFNLVNDTIISNGNKIPIQRLGEDAPIVEFFDNYLVIGTTYKVDIKVRAQKFIPAK